MIYIIFSSYAVLLLNLSTHHINTLYISYSSHPPIISMYNSIQDNNITIQHEGLLQMRKVLSSDYPHIELFANSGIIVLLSNLLLSTNENIRMETAWCLTNIATGIDTLIMNINAHVSNNMNINTSLSTCLHQHEH